MRLTFFLFLFFFNDPATTEIYTLSLHDALPISTSISTRLSCAAKAQADACAQQSSMAARTARSEEHTSELQSQSNLVCRLLLEKKKTQLPPRPCAPLRPRPAPPRL